MAKKTPDTLWSDADEAQLATAIDDAGRLYAQFGALARLDGVLKAVPLAKRRLGQLDAEREGKAALVTQIDEEIGRMQARLDGAQAQWASAQADARATLEELEKLIEKRRGQVAELDERSTTLRAELAEMKAEREAILARFRG